MGKPRRRQAKEVEFDLTPMIDVTFQLLIFFILVMKFKTIERRHETRLPTDEGTQNTPPTPPKEQLTLRMKYDHTTGQMAYIVSVGADKSAADQINVGTLQELLADRFNPARPLYTGTYQRLLDQLREKHTRAVDTEKIELAMAPNTQMSSLLQVGDTAPWGFVTLAIDACTKYNQELKDRGKDMLAITFKNMESSVAISN